MLDWIVVNPIPAGGIGLGVGFVYFLLVKLLERKVMNMIRAGDTVVHDYSLHTGVVLQKRRHKSGYNYEVRFYLPENNEYRIDWYKRDMLRLKHE